MTAVPDPGPMTHQIVLLLDDDVMITEGLAAGLAREGRTIITANDLESGEMVVEWLNPSHIVSDVRLTGPFGFEGLDFIRFAKKRSPDSRIILMTGDAPDALQLEASERGAVAFLQKPFDIKALDSVLDLMAPPRKGSPEWPEIIRVPLLDDVLNSPHLTTAFQPIVRLNSGDAVGYEALTRFQTDSPMRDPQMLFHYASRKQRIAELEVACVNRSIRAGASLSEFAPLFLNIHPGAFASGSHFTDAVTTAAQAAGVAMRRIVLEITEQGSLNDERRGLDTIRNLKALGIRFAFDDVGMAYSHLPYVDRIRPEFLKISQHFGTGFESDDTKGKIVKNLLSLAKAFESELIIEGVETAATAAAALDLGIKYGQGYYFARPDTAAHCIPRR